MKSLQGVFAMVLIGMIGVARVLGGPPERLLLSRATRVTKEETSWENDVGGYCWLSNQEALMSRYDSHTGSYLVRLNLPDGKETKLPGWPNDDVLISSRAKKLQVSPDRQWLFTVMHGVDTSTLFGGRLDGTHPFDYFGENLHVGQIFWLSDSVHGLEFRENRLLGNTQQ